MKTLLVPHRVLALAMAALVSACGGGSSPSAADSFAAQLSPGAQRSDRFSALSTSTRASDSVSTAVSNDQLFEWAQLTYPELFSGTPTPFANVLYEGKIFSGRAYPNGNYLAVANGEAFGLGPFTSGTLTNFGAVQSYSAQVCAKVNCGSSGAGGSLNVCTAPASQALATGSTYRGVYVNTTFAPVASSGQFTHEGVVNGPTTFEGQAAVLTTGRIYGVQQGEQIDLTTKHYDKAAANELTASLGSEFDTSLGGQVLTTRTVNSPAWLNNEFTLQLGASLTKTTSSTTSFVNAPVQLPPQTASSTSTYTWEARETITVLGRSYDTCRYRMTTLDSSDVETLWHIVGKGFTAKQESRSAAGAVLNRSELKEGRINGALL